MAVEVVTFGALLLSTGHTMKKNEKKTKPY